jgi:acyl-CoA thioester hydrolase
MWRSTHLKQVVTRCMWHRKQCNTTLPDAVLDSYKGTGYPGRVTFQLRWRDMDAMSHVNHALYFTYFEQARCELWGRAGLLLDGTGEGPILKAISAEFKAPLKFPGSVTVGVRTEELSSREYEQHYAVVSHDSGRVVATARAVFVNYDYDSGVPAEISDDMRLKLFS